MRYKGGSQMKIGNGTSLNAVNMQMKKSNNQDGQVKSIQKQISNNKEQLQKLSENKEMSIEQKAEKKKELQQQMQDLNKQLMQRQQEIQKEKQIRPAEKQAPKTGTEKSNAGNMGTATMQGIIGASSMMSQIKTTSAVKSSMEGRSKILEVEIKLDGGRGAATEHKEAELVELNGKIKDVDKNISEQISDVNKTLEESKESDNSVKRDTDKKDDEKIKDSGETTVSKENDIREEKNISQANEDEAISENSVSYSERNHQTLDVKA